MPFANIVYPLFIVQLHINEALFKWVIILFDNVLRKQVCLRLCHLLVYLLSIVQVDGNAVLFKEVGLLLFDNALRSN